MAARTPATPWSCSWPTASRSSSRSRSAATPHACSRRATTCSARWQPHSAPIPEVHAHPHRRSRPPDQPQRSIAAPKSAPEAVKEWLVDWGIAAARIETKGYGSSQPLVPRGKRGARQVNDRVELIILEKKVKRKRSKRFAEANEPARPWPGQRGPTTARRIAPRWPGSWTEIGICARAHRFR